MGNLIRQKSRMRIGRFYPSQYFDSCSNHPQTYLLLISGQLSVCVANNALETTSQHAGITAKRDGLRRTGPGFTPQHNFV